MAAGALGRHEGRWGVEALENLPPRGPQRYCHLRIQGLLTLLHWSGSLGQELRGVLGWGAELCPGKGLGVPGVGGSGLSRRGLRVPGGSLGCLGAAQVCLAPCTFPAPSWTPAGERCLLVVCPEVRPAEVLSPVPIQEASDFHWFVCPLPSAWPPCWWPQEADMLFGGQSLAGFLFS